MCTHCGFTGDDVIYTGSVKRLKKRKRRSRPTLFARFHTQCRACNRERVEPLDRTCSKENKKQSEIRVKVGLNTAKSGKVKKKKKTTPSTSGSGGGLMAFLKKF